MEVHEFVLAIAHTKVQDTEHLAATVLDVMHVARVLFVQHASTERGHWESCKYATASRKPDLAEI